MSVSIPVFLVNKHGGRDADNVECSPCIDVVIVNEGKAKKGIALLDSGAAGIYGDPGFLQVLNLPEVGRDTYFSANHSSESSIRSAIMWIDHIPDLEIEIQEVPVRSTGMPYDIVLGRSFLTMFDFGFDLRTKAWKLTLPGVSRSDNSNRLVHTVF